MIAAAAFPLALYFPLQRLLKAWRPRRRIRIGNSNGLLEFVRE